MGALIDRVTRQLLRRGLRRGLLEGSVVWLVVALGSGLVRLMVRKEMPRVVREDLREGETIIVTHARAPGAASSRRRRTPTPGDAS